MMTALFVYRRLGNKYLIGNLDTGELRYYSEFDIITAIRQGISIYGVTINGNQYWINEFDLSRLPFKCSCGQSNIVVNWTDIAKDCVSGREIVVSGEACVASSSMSYNLGFLHAEAAHKLNCSRDRVLLATRGDFAPSEQVLVSNNLNLGCLGAKCKRCGRISLPFAFIG